MFGNCEHEVSTDTHCNFELSTPATVALAVSTAIAGLILTFTVNVAFCCTLLEDVVSDSPPVSAKDLGKINVPTTAKAIVATSAK
jgi:hypothetical protein